MECGRWALSTWGLTPPRALMASRALLLPRAGVPHHGQETELRTAITCSLGRAKWGLRVDDGGDWALLLLRSFSIIKCQVANTTNYFFL